MSVVLKLCLQGLPARTNSIGRSHWALKVKEAQNWKRMVGAHAAAYGIPKKPLEKAKLTLVRHSSSEPDFDGLVSSFKHVIDGLISARVIVSDKPSCVGQPTYRWEKTAPRKGFITVTVEDEAA